MPRKSQALSARSAAAAAGLPADVLFAWLRRGHLRRPVCGWREADVAALIAMRLLTQAGLDCDAAGLLAQNGLAGALAAGRGFAVLVTSTSLSPTGAHTQGGVLVVDDLSQVQAAIAARLRQGGAAQRFVIVDLAEVARRAADGFVAASDRPKAGRPRKEAA